MAINPVLLALANRQAGQEKSAFQPPQAGADPAAAGGMPPTDPAAAGVMPPGPAPPAADPMAAAAGAMPGMPPMDPTMMGMVPPAAGAGPGGQKIKPEQWMQALDYRMYNVQQQITALMNALGVELPAGALVTPPGMPAAPAMEAAQPGGAQDPSQQTGPQPEVTGGSAINAIEPMQAASPELAQKTAADWPTAVAEFKREADANCPAGFRVVLVKAGETSEPIKSSPPEPLRGGHPGKTPSLSGPPTAGGSADPKSRPDTNAPMTPANATVEGEDEAGDDKQAAAFGADIAAGAMDPALVVGDATDMPSRRQTVSPNLSNQVAATAAMYRSRVNADATPNP